MREEDAIYGGEMSAHHYFRDFAYCDSGMIPWLLVTELLCLKGKTLGELVRDRMAAFPAKAGRSTASWRSPPRRLPAEQHLPFTRWKLTAPTASAWRFHSGALTCALQYRAGGVPESWNPRAMAYADGSPNEGHSGAVESVIN